MKPLETVLADWREDANRLRALGHPAQANTIDQVVESVASAAEPYLDWLTDDDCRTRSGKSVDFWRAKFPDLEAQGLAKREGRRRLYRRCAVPQRANLEAARAAARREANAA